jgi:hypothetical protein
MCWSLDSISGINSFYLGLLINDMQRLFCSKKKKTKGIHAGRGEKVVGEIY